MENWEKINSTQRKNTKTYLVRLHKKKDKDIIEFLEDCTNKNGLIKILIREEIEKVKKN